MSDRWVKRSLNDAETLARRVLNDSATDASRRQMAREILDTIASIDRRSIRCIDGTLVVTRLEGLDVPPGVGSSIHENLARHFDDILEVDRQGRVLPGDSFRGFRC